MKILTSIIGAVAVAALLVGCGGGGGGNNGGGAAQLTKQQVRALLENGLKNSDNVIGNEGNTVTATRGAKATESGNRLTKRGPSKKVLTRDHDQNENFFFDETTGLWTEVIGPNFEDPEQPSGYRFYVDHEKTQPAGHELTTYVSPDHGITVTHTWELIFTAGNFAGEQHHEERKQNADGTGGIVGTGIIPGYGSYEFEGKWGSSDPDRWTQRFTYEDESWQAYVYTRGDDEDTMVITSNLGVTISLTFLIDQSGDGTITGNGEALPAQIVWDAEGNGTITWADQTAEPINVFDLIYENGGF